MLVFFHPPVKCPISHAVCCTQGEVTLSTSTKVAIKLLESKKLSFATLSPAAQCEDVNQTSPKKAGVYIKRYPCLFHAPKIAS
jgi:hypothetical protein